MTTTERGELLTELATAYQYIFMLEDENDRLRARASRCLELLDLAVSGWWACPC